MALLDDSDLRPILTTFVPPTMSVLLKTKYHCVEINVLSRLRAFPDCFPPFNPFPNLFLFLFLCVPLFLSIYIFIISPSLLPSLLCLCRDLVIICLSISESLPPFSLIPFGVDVFLLSDY